MLRVLACLVAGCVLTGCTASKVAVMPLDRAIEEVARKAKAGAHGASKEVTLEVSATHGYTAGMTIPIPVVPIGVEATGSTGSTITITIDLDKFPDQVDTKLLTAKRTSGEAEAYILDKNTSRLTPLPLKKE